METKVYKYPLTGSDECHLSATVPAGAKIIHVGMQGNVFVIWCIVQPDTAVMEDLYFTVVGTGFDVPPDGVHVGTVFHGPFVWHLFQEELVRM
jgi:hypothetical protein